jgi:hypothetical protein
MDPTQPKHLTSKMSLSLPTPICRPTPLMWPRATSALMAKKSYPMYVSLRMKANSAFTTAFAALKKEYCTLKYLR